jgi:hypothetical protein
MKKVLLALLTIGLVLPMAAHAEPPVDVEGYFTYIPTCGEPHWANDNEVYRDCTDVGDYYAGDFLGTSTEVYDVVFHDSQGNFVYEYGWYKGTVTFTGTVYGRGGGAEDTVLIMFVGKSPGDVFTWTGSWRIIGGTGEFANLQGQGFFGSSDNPDYPGVHYEGKIKFAP